MSKMTEALDDMQGPYSDMREMLDKFDSDFLQWDYQPDDPRSGVHDQIERLRRVTTTLAEEVLELGDKILQFELHNKIPQPGDSNS